MRAFLHRIRNERNGYGGLSLPGGGVLFLYIMSQDNKSSGDFSPDGVPGLSLAIAVSSKSIDLVWVTDGRDRGSFLRDDCAKVSVLVDLRLLGHVPQYSGPFVLQICMALLDHANLIDVLGDIFPRL